MRSYKGDCMYTTIEEAKVELWKRWNDQLLKEKAREYIKILPEYFEAAPRAVIARQVASPNFESEIFFQSASTLKLSPLWWEYSGDKFVAANPDKKAWGKMVFYGGRGKNNGAKRDCYNVIDFNRFDGKPLNQIQTVWGENFVEFHNRLAVSHVGQFEIFKATSWMNDMGGKAEIYYKFFLAVFICHGILFENFLSTPMEEDFKTKIVLPCIRELKEYFGLEPLIVPILPLESETDPYWTWYPEKFKEVKKIKFQPETIQASA